MKLSIKDVLPNPAGTTVKEVDSQGNLTGREFKSVAWSIRDQDPQNPGGCPTWIDKIVVSETVEGAKRGAGLIREAVVIASSSFSSRDLQAIHVDQSGQQIETFQVPYGLVAAVSANPPQDATAPIAAELWFSQQPFDRTATPVAIMETRCTHEAGGPGSNG